MSGIPSPDADVLTAIDMRRDALEEVMGFVQAHPELGHEEQQTSAHLAARLEEAGLAVERGIAGMDTAFRAILDGARAGKTVGLAMLYDAVPSVTTDGALRPVHSCGHPAIAAGVVTAASALAAVRTQLAGRVVVVGCPADEIHAPRTRQIGGGKALTAARGVWDDMDAALYAHPEFIDTVSLASLWMRRDRLHVAGTRSLRADRPQEPLRALRGLMKAASESDPARLMLEHVELDGDVEEGTGLVLDATVLYFGSNEADIAATAATTRADAGGEWTEGMLVQGVAPDAAVTAAVADAFAALGKHFVADPPALPFATDFGNISRRVPSALIGVGRPGGWAFHTPLGARQFASPDAVECALDIARVLALAALRVLG